MFKDSEYQKEVYKVIEQEENNVLINAVAGSGKTTTLVRSLEYIPRMKDVNFCAFNKSISDHLKTRVKKGIDVSTIHSFGFSSLMRSFGKMKVEEKKVISIIYDNLKRYGIKKANESSFVYNISKLVDMIRMNDCESDLEMIESLVQKHSIFCGKDDIEKAIEILNKSDAKESVDFTDMLYRAVKKNVKTKKYDIVYVDESQDLSIIQQKLISMMLKPQGRLVAVGDPNQAIYGFAGADVESFNKMKQIPNITELPLSVCYRSGKQIVRYAQKVVPHIECFEDAQEGMVSTGYEKMIRPGDWVLCRNFKPLFALALRKFRQRIPVYIKGYDLGNDLLELIRKADHDSLIVCKMRLNAILDKYMARLVSFGIEKPEKTASYNELKDKVDIILEVIFPIVKTVAEAKSIIVEIFKEKREDQRITFSTIHKAKGFEADRIFVLEQELMPSKYATMPWQLEQERNLQYVCYTRAKKELIFLEDPK